MLADSLDQAVKAGYVLGPKPQQLWERMVRVQGVRVRDACAGGACEQLVAFSSVTTSHHHHHTPLPSSPTTTIRNTTHHRLIYPPAAPRTK